MKTEAAENDSPQPPAADPKKDGDAAPAKPFKELTESEKQAVLQEALTRDQCVDDGFGTV
jgi:hypothetical protein